MKSGRKVFFYTHALAGGGAERVWALLASGFAARGWDVTFVVDFDTDENAGYLAPNVRRVTLGGNHLTATLRLAKLLATQKPDISISAISVSNLKHTIAATLSFRPNRAILSYHGYWVTEPQKLSRIGYTLTPLLNRMTACTIGVSQGLTDYLLRVWHTAKKRTVRIYNPVSAPAGQPALRQDDLRARGPNVLAAGRMVSYKNFPFLIRAFKQVKTPNAHLSILGDGVDRPQIEAEIKAQGMESRITLLGYRPDPWSHYEKAALFVLPSDSEPFGLVVVEAMALGLPVVSTDCEGPREILENGRYGPLVPQGDEAAFAAAIDAALENPGDPEQRIRRANDFSVEAGVDNYERLMNDILGSLTLPSARIQEKTEQVTKR